MTKKKKRNGRDDAICLRLLVIEPKLEFTRIYATTRCSSVVAGFHDLVVSFLELLHSFLLLPGNEQAQLPRVTIDDFLATKHHSPGSLPLRYVFALRYVRANCSAAAGRSDLGTFSLLTSSMLRRPRSMTVGFLTWALIEGCGPTGCSSLPLVLHCNWRPS